MSPDAAPLSTVDSDKKGTRLAPWHVLTLRANLVAQVGIVLTGGIVRVTSSGLGCPTWPECVDGSITPTSDQTQAWHKYIEFGNRLLTFALVVVAVLTILAVRSINKSRLNQSHAPNRSLTVLSYGGLAGIFAQAILGGITVLTGLNPLSVAAHFLVSIGLITLALALLMRANYSPQSQLSTHPLIRKVLRGLLVIGFSVIVLGTLVTGSGPHAGDSAEITRLPFDPRLISWLHADVVILFLGLLLGVSLAVRLHPTHPEIVTALNRVVIITLLQGTLGYVQYFTNLPWVLVALHMLGACLLWISLYRVWLIASMTTPALTKAD